MTKGSDKLPGNRFVKIKGEDVTIHFTSDDPDIISVDEQGRIYPKADGSTTLRIEIGSEEISVPMEVIQIPILPRATKEQVAEELGAPDEMSTSAVRYRKYPTVKTGSMAETWRYDIYPGAALTFIGDNLFKLSTDPRPRDFL